MSSVRSGYTISTASERVSESGLAYFILVVGEVRQVRGCKRFADSGDDDGRKDDAGDDKEGLHEMVRG